MFNELFDGAIALVIRDGGGIDIDRHALDADRAPAAYFSTLPIVRIADAIRAEGVPAVISNTAGTFVCNQLMYGVLHYIEEEALPIRAGFIHIPFAPEQAARQSAPMPSMSIEDSARAIETAIRTLAGSE
ncbi:MAG: hypothetical protein IIT70_00325 [Clostridia bacterium]|nr:hypothetical protein [Clostridia bacterium]